MNLDHLDGTLKPGLVEAASDVRELLAELPSAYRAFLDRSDGVDLSAGGVLYSAGDLIERNATYEVARYQSGCVAIGDDGGGYACLLRKGEDSPVFVSDHGSLQTLVEIAPTFEAWVESGCSMEQPDQPAELPSLVDVYLDVVPEGKLKNLIAIKNELGLETGLAELKKLSEALPARIAENVPSGKYRVRCDALNERFGNCLSLH